LALYERFQLLVDRYYGNQLARQVVALQSQMVDSVERHRDAAAELERQGQIARVERLAAEVALDDVITAQSRAESQLNMSTLALAQMIRESPDRLTSNLFIEVALAARSEYVAQTLESFPGLDVLDARRAQSESAVDIENSEYLPKVFLFGDYQAYESDSILADSIPDWQVGIGVSVPLFDNSGRSSRALAAENVRAEVESLVRQARADLQLLVSQTYELAVQAQDEYRRLATALELADENLRLREQSFREGFGTSRDVVDALTYRTSVETRRAVVAYDFVRHYAKLCVLSGQLPEFINRSERS
jgi:outer membrane protein TolC